MTQKPSLESGPRPVGIVAAREGALELLAPVLALFDACSPHGLAELERTLAHRLSVRTTPAEERVALLYPLAELLRSQLAKPLPHHPIAKHQIECSVYDDLRPEGAPTSGTLIRRFGGTEHGGWLWAQRAADGLLVDGRKRGKGQPWPHPSRGKRGEPDTTPEEVVASIRACALALCRRPSSHYYTEWVRIKRRQLRLGAESAKSLPRLCHWGSIKRHFGTWGAALAAADITDAELAAARAARAPFHDGRAPTGDEIAGREA